MAARALEWGYSVLEIHNATHLYFEQRGCDRHNGHHDRDEVIDSTWIVQRQHGSFLGRVPVGAEAATEMGVRDQRRRLRRGQEEEAAA